MATKNSAFVWAMALCAVIVSGTGTEAAPLRRIAMEDVINVHGGLPLNLSVDREGLLADIDETGVNTGDLRTGRGLIEWSRGKARLMEDGVAPARSPDGRWLLFAQADVWVLKDLQTGAERRSPSGRPITVASGGPVWSSDSRFVAANYNVRGEDLYRSDTPTLLAPGVRVVIHDQRRGGPAPAPMQINPRLMIWDVREAHPAVTDTGGYGSYPGSWRTGAEGHDYYYSVAQEGGVGLEAYTVVKGLHAETETERDLYKLPNFNQGLKPQVSRDGARLAFVADPTTPDFGVSGRVLVLDLQNGDVRSLAPTTSAIALQWGADGRIYFLKPDGGLPQLCSLSLDGELRTLTRDAIGRRELAVSPDGQTIAYRGADGYGRSDLRIWSIGEQQERIVATLADPAAKFALGRFERTQWLTPDGVHLNGFLIYPPSFDPKRRYPLLLDIHGGGPGVGFGFYGLLGVIANTPLDWHAWASLDYVVFVPDFRSSGEYGAAINTKIATANADLGGVEEDAMDIASGVNEMRKRPYIDPARIVAIAQSAGGPRLAYLLTRTNLFAAAVLHDSIPFDPDALTVSLAKFGGPALWTRAKLSPSQQELLEPDFLFDSWRVKTPTLILVGNQAHGAVDPSSSETLYSILLSEHVPTRFIRYLDDGHGAASVATARSRFDEVSAWLERYGSAGAVASRDSQARTQSSIAIAR